MIVKKDVPTETNVSLNYNDTQSPYHHIFDRIKTGITNNNDEQAKRILDAVFSCFDHQALRRHYTNGLDDLEKMVMVIDADTITTHSILLMTADDRNNIIKNFSRAAILFFRSFTQTNPLEKKQSLKNALIFLGINEQQHDNHIKNIEALASNEEKKKFFYKIIQGLYGTRSMVETKERESNFILRQFLYETPGRENHEIAYHDARTSLPWEQPKEVHAFHTGGHFEKLMPIEDIIHLNFALRHNHQHGERSIYANAFIPTNR
jgi:hypothetical protein